MAYTNKKPKVIEPTAFPDYLAPDEVKATKEYGLQMSKAIEYEWWYRPENGVCAYYDKREKYHRLRLYARGEQDTKLYKDLMTGGDTTSYANFDWRPLQIIPKFVKLITNQMTERLFDIKAEATDKFSTDLKDDYQKNLEKLIMAKPAMVQAQKVLGVNLMPDNMDEMPETQEEVDLFMKLKYKPAIEIAAEEAMKYTLDLNNYNEIQTRVVEDIVTIGLGGIKLITDPQRGIVIDYVDPAECVHSYPKDRDFNQVHYYGEVERINIHELKRASNGAFTDEQIREMAVQTSEWNKYHNNTNGSQYREDDLPNSMVDVMHFTFKSTNTITYKKKYNRNGGFQMTKRESTFSKPDSKYKGYDVAKKTIDVWYKGSLVLGTNQVYMNHLSLSGQNKENSKMASPRKRRLRKMLRAGLLKAASAAEAVAEVVAPVEAPAPLVDAPVVQEEKKSAPKKAKKAPKKKADA